jgi:protein-S-isoprenylcysteine O-methyltransferase Ste14
MKPYFAVHPATGVAFGISDLIWFVPEMFTTRRYHSRAGADIRDRGSMWVLLACIWSSVFIGFWAAFQFRSMMIQSAQLLIFTLGIVLMLAGVVFRWYAIRILGRYFTPEVAVKSDQKIVETGPYRFIRHPAYSGSLLTLLGLGLALTSWLSLACIMLAAIIGYGYRVRVEESALCNELGDDYRNYMDHTRRFIPFVF